MGLVLFYFILVLVLVLVFGFGFGFGFGFVSCVWVSSLVFVDRNAGWRAGVRVILIRVRHAQNRMG